MKKIKRSICKYCEAGFPSYPYGRDESCHCANCGAEWEPIVIEQIDEVYAVERALEEEDY